MLHPVIKMFQYHPGRKREERGRMRRGHQKIGPMEVRTKIPEVRKTGCGEELEPGNGKVGFFPGH